MNEIRIPPLSAEAAAELEELYQKTRDVRLRLRAQIILLSAEHDMIASDIATIVRKDENTVRRWLKRYLAEGTNGLYDRPRPGASVKVTDAFKEELVRIVRQRPRSLGLSFSLWTLQRLADYMAEKTGIRVEDETIRLHLKAAAIVLSRPQHKISRPDPEYEVKKRRLKQAEII